MNDATYGGIQPRIGTVTRTIRAAWAFNWPLTLLGCSMLVALAAMIVGIVVDPRVITGAPAWLKPAKFALSLSIYAFTFLWLLHFIDGHPRLVKLAANATALTATVEMVILITQAARGTTSHFNFATPLDTTLYATMGSFIVLLWMMNLLAGILLIFQRMANPVFAWGLRLGVLLSFVGMGLAFFMTAPSAAQQTALVAGAKVTILGAHSVGVADGGPGLPVLGWSTVGGDLRAAHFVGLHALQVLPLLGWLLVGLRFSRLRTGHRVTLVWTAAGAYLGVMMVLLWQALRGQSIIAPDPLTLEVVAMIIGGAALCVLGVLIHSRMTGGAPSQGTQATTLV